MRKAIASAALAAMLSMGLGTAAMAATSTAPTAQVEEATTDDDGGFEWGLLGLVGLLGLAGLARGGGGGGGRSKGGSGGSAYRPAKAPRGGHTTDWSR